MQDRVMHTVCEMNVAREKIFLKMYDTGQRAVATKGRPQIYDTGQ